MTTIDIRERRDYIRQHVAKHRRVTKLQQRLDAVFLADAEYTFDAWAEPMVWLDLGDPTKAVHVPVAPGGGTRNKHDRHNLDQG